MDKIRLGRTELMVSACSFGALPIQRCSFDDAARILRKAYDNGINYFDTANMYTDSELKLGLALGDVRHNIIISTKSGGKDKATVAAHIENSLRALHTDYIDLFQFHNPPSMPLLDDENGPFAAALEAKRKGYIRHIGITNHRLALAQSCIESGLFETLQFPFSYIGTAEEIELAHRCKQADMGFIAMKGLAGGLLNNAKACMNFIKQFDNVVPIWGIQSEAELDEWLALEKAGDFAITAEIQAIIEHDRKELSGNFCRSCGYCLPCPAGIDIPQAARMSRLLRRSPYQPYMSAEWHAKMHRIDDCLGCGVCASRCPYGLNTPKLLKEMLADYDQFYAEHKN